jgi:cyclopropane-fatty-acyl-phospholipid synthase
VSIRLTATTGKGKQVDGGPIFADNILMSQREHKRGASAAAIQKHYDVGNEFYRLWLDPTLCYSCALWAEGDSDDQLEAAQLRKIDFHIDAARARDAARVLDIGCGWGAALRRLVDFAGVSHATGLTLSREQAEYVAGWKHPRLEARLESWTDHAPPQPYDALVAIGPLEHCARPQMSPAQKVAAYREFFLRCHAWLKPGGRLSLQTITFGNIDAHLAQKGSAKAFFEEIFPESDLPALPEIFSACAGWFEPVNMRNDRADYERTCRVWAARLAARRAEAIAAAGQEAFTRFARYLKASAAIFHYHYAYLLRIAFERLDEPTG